MSSNLGKKGRNQLLGETKSIFPSERWGQPSLRCEFSVKRTKPSAFQQPLGPSVARFSRSSSFFVIGKSYKGLKLAAMCFQCFKDGTLLALVKNRRSGAQRGASENNFGQRFSVSTPCFTLPRRPALPGFFSANLDTFLNFPSAFCHSPNFCHSERQRGTCCLLASRRRLRTERHDALRMAELVCGQKRERAALLTAA
jgi:hypothetical protein